VQPDRIVVYRIFDTLEPDVLLSEQLITPEQQKKIRDAISAIPSDSYGMLFWEGGLTHGPFLRLSFTSDGSFAERRIEFCGVFENWLRALCSAVSEPMTTEKKIEFEAAVKARRERLAKIGFVPPMLRTPIAEFYGPPRAEKNSPNQALEPTSTAVTPPAVAGDRASGTRGSP
jgi:hypothetical protein